MARSPKQTRREAKRLLHWCMVQGELDEDRVRRAVKKIRDSHRRGYLDLLVQFQRFIEFKLAAHTADVETPFVPSQAFRKVTETSLRKTYGPKTIAKFAQRPELIGGIRIRIGCDVYDGSVLSKLTFLERNLGIVASPRRSKAA